MLNRISVERCRTQTVTNTLGQNTGLYQKIRISRSLPQNSQISPEHA